MSDTKEEQEELLHCSFCGKSSKEVELLIAAPDAFICDACVELARDIIGTHRTRKNEPPAPKVFNEEKVNMLEAKVKKLQEQLDEQQQD